MKVEDGLYREQGEIARWAVRRSNDTQAAETRLSVWEPYVGTAHIAIYDDADPEGTMRVAMMLDAEHVEELIADLKEVLPILKGEPA